ncbi:MAG: class I SAM-dependent DNA methyltransferase [Candidatus Sumerlaeota bacterium]|nr:class I SAM-dependent DNA methyltransferase [Candidatus Sumerlaeota bacterium]
MANNSQQIVAKAWNFAHVLRDDGLSYMAYTEQITFLLFLKMAHEVTQPPHSKPAIVPKGLDWPSLLARDGDELEVHYRHILEELGKKPGMLGEIFLKARQEIQNPATLKRLIVDLIGAENWSAMEADVKGDIYEGLLARSAQESPKGAGQYFTPRELIKAVVDVMRPGPGDTVCDPACGTGGFLLAAHDYVLRERGRSLDPDQKRHLRSAFIRGWELVPATARLCVMNLYLHGIGPSTEDAARGGECPIVAGLDSLAADLGERFSMVLTNPPFGRKSSIAIVTEEGELEKEDHAYERQDFWTTTKNKQLNFLQHVKTLLKVNGRCAIVVPDNVLFEGGAGETVRRNLLQQFDVHTLLRLPTGIFYAQGVKANVLFFDAKPAREEAWTKRLWVYDLRTNMHFTLKTNPLRRADLDEFVEVFKPGKPHLRKPTWDAEKRPEGRWRAFDYEELAKRDKANLDIFWLRDKSLEDGDDLPDPATLAQEIADDLQTALEQFSAIAADLRNGGGGRENDPE